LSKKIVVLCSAKKYKFHHIIIDIAIFRALKLYLSLVYFWPILRKGIDN